ncbi:MAG: cold-shock protein [Coriobacteriia bacterium]
MRMKKLTRKRQPFRAGRTVEHAVPVDVTHVTEASTCMFARPHRGIVKWFDYGKGLGLVQLVGGEDVLVHVNKTSEEVTDLPRGHRVIISPTQAITGEEGAQAVLSWRSPANSRSPQRISAEGVGQEQLDGSKAIEDRFNQLADEWLEQSEHMSSAAQMAMLPSYQQIIGMGTAAVPLIIKRLQERHGHWFWALKSITGEDPVRPEHRGRVDDMASDWIEWASHHQATV